MPFFSINNDIPKISTAINLKSGKVLDELSLKNNINKEKQRNGSTQ